MSDIRERLLATYYAFGDAAEIRLVMNDAAAEIDRIRALNAEMLMALKDATVHFLAAKSAYEEFAGNSKRPGTRDALYSSRLSHFEEALARARVAIARATTEAA